MWIFFFVKYQIKEIEKFRICLYSHLALFIAIEITQFFFHFKMELFFFFLVMKCWQFSIKISNAASSGH